MKYPIDKAGRSRNARINQAVTHAEKVLGALKAVQGRDKFTYIDLKDEWYEGRNELEQLTQCFHEANAYNNVMKPES